MLMSWRDWQLPYVRWIYASLALVIGLTAGFVFEAGLASGLIGLLIAFLLVSGLELWFRRRHVARSGKV